LKSTKPISIYLKFPAFKLCHEEAYYSLSLEGRGCRVRVIFYCIIIFIPVCTVLLCKEGLFSPPPNLPPQGGGIYEECRLFPQGGGIYEECRLFPQEGGSCQESRLCGGGVVFFVDKKSFIRYVGATFHIFMNKANFFVSLKNLFLWKSLN